VFETFAKKTEVAPDTTLWNSLMSAPAKVSPSLRERQTQMTIRRNADLTGNANLGGPNENAVVQLARSQFIRSQSTLDTVRPGDVGADAAREVAQVTRQFVPQWSAEISAVAAGRKPLFHEDLGFLNEADLERAAAHLQRQVPAGIQVALRDGHLYVYNPGLLTQFTSGAAPGLDEVIANRDNGLWLGYGVNWPGPGAVQVVIRDFYGQGVASFYAPSDQADYFGRARAKDWSDATGRKFTWSVIGRRA
jgi:hypothetical protein